MRILAVTEQYWPEGGGGNLATHLIINQISQFNEIEVLVLSGTFNPVKINGVNYLFSPLFSTSNKIMLWRNLALLSKHKWFLKLLSSVDALYIPRYCYPLIPMAKRHGKRVIVHLHDYQPISYNAAVFPGEYATNFLDKLKDEIRFELIKHSSIGVML